MTADSVDVRFAPILDGMEFLSAVYARHEFAKHMHDTFAFGVVDGGAGRVWCGGSTHLGLRGDVIAIAPGVVHTGAEGPRTSDAPFRYRMVYPSNRLVAAAIERLELQRVPLPRGEPMLRDHAVASHFNRLFDALWSNSPPLEVDTRLYSFLARYRARRPARIPPGSRSVPSFVRRVREYLDANTHANVRLAQLGDIAGVHPLYLCRVFRMHVGLPPHAYALHARLMHAKDLLRAARPVSDVATTTGFADQSHLGRHFVRVVGTTPAAYQRMVLRR